MLLLLNTNQGIPVEDIDLQGLLVLLNRHAEVILPAIQIGRLAGGLTLFITILVDLNSTGVDLRRVQVKNKQVLPLTADKLADHLVAMLGIPAHHGHDLAEKQRTNHLFGLASCCAPGKRIFDILTAGPNCQFLLLLINQYLHKIGRG